MIFWCYYLCVTTEPGRVPDKWVRAYLSPAGAVEGVKRGPSSPRLSSLPSPRLLSTLTSLQEPDPGREDMEVKKLTGGPRYCSKCSAYKPPRAHHCKVCNRCILRMGQSYLPRYRPEAQDRSCLRRTMQHADSRPWLPDRSPLPLGRELHRPPQLRLVHPLPDLCRPGMYVCDVLSLAVCPSRATYS